MSGRLSASPVPGAVDGAGAAAGVVVLFDGLTADFFVADFAVAALGFVPVGADVLAAGFAVAAVGFAAGAAAGEFDDFVAVDVTLEATGGVFVTADAVILATFAGVVVFAATVSARTAAARRVFDASLLGNVKPSR